MEREAVHLHNEESVEQEVHPANSGQVDLGVVADSVGFEEVLGVDLDNGFGPQVQEMQCRAHRSGSFARELAFQQLQRHTMQP